MTIKQWIEVLRDQPQDRIEQRLQHEKQNIKFLESIYMTGGENSFYSQRFRDAAYQERQEICQLTSALHEILRTKFNH